MWEDKMYVENKTKKLTLMAMFAALAYVLMLVGRIPISPMPFLKYDPKDLILAISGFVLGPIPSLLITLVVCLIEMFTASDTGFIGFFMNLLASACFACPAAFFYKRKHSIRGGVLGLVIGVALMTGAMLLWNYFLTPLYMVEDLSMAAAYREEVAAMLIPIFLPFNLIKGSINAALTVLVYKPVSKALKRSGLVAGSPSPKAAAAKKRFVGVYIAAAMVLVSCIFAVLVMKGVI